MEFNCIDEIKKYIIDLKNNCDENSRWFKDLVWFSSNNYTTTSEYFGELMLFIEKLIVDDEMKKYKFDLIQLEDSLKKYFK